MRKLLFSILFILVGFLILLPENTQAQGTCRATRRDVNRPPRIIENKCDPNFKPKIIFDELGIGFECKCLPAVEVPTPICEKKDKPCQVDLNCRFTERGEPIEGCEEFICYAFPGGEKRCAPPEVLTQEVRPQITPCPVMGTTGIQTALGCIPTGNVTQSIAWFLRLAIGIGGGIAFLLMLFGVFQIITSAGDPERLKAGKELITSALIGLLMIIFSVFLLQLIGVQILQIPGF